MVTRGPGQIDPGFWFEDPHICLFHGMLSCFRDWDNSPGHRFQMGWRRRAARQEFPHCAFPLWPAPLLFCVLNFSLKPNAPNLARERKHMYKRADLMLAQRE